MGILLRGTAIDRRENERRKEVVLHISVAYRRTASASEGATRREAAPSKGRRRAAPDACSKMLQSQSQANPHLRIYVQVFCSHLAFFSFFFFLMLSHGFSFFD